MRFYARVLLTEFSCHCQCDQDYSTFTFGPLNNLAYFLGYFNSLFEQTNEKFFNDTKSIHIFGRVRLFYCSVL